VWKEIAAMHHPKRIVFLGLGAAACLAASGPALADGPVVIHGVAFPEPPTSMSIETDDGWRFESAAITGEIVGFLASYSGTGGTATSIRLAWFEPSGTGAWAGWGWEGASGATEAEAIAYLIDFYQDAQMFQHSAEWRDADFSGVAAPAPPVPLRYGFDEADPFQPVLEHMDPELAEVIVEAGAAGMPVLAPMALPSAGGGGNFSLACVLGEYDASFSEFAEATGISNDDGTGAPGGGDCGPEDARCKKTVTTYTFGPDCSPWSGWSVQRRSNGTPYCRRERDCRSHTRTIIIHEDCRVEQKPDEFGPWVKSYGDKAVNAQGVCDP
jgi:hypothetical protein